MFCRIYNNMFIFLILFLLGINKDM